MIKPSHPFQRRLRRTRQHCLLRRTVAPLDRVFGAFTLQRWAATLAAIRICQRPFQIRPELFKIHCTEKGFQLVPRVAQSGKPVLNIEKSTLLHAAFPEQITENPESYPRRRRYGFFDPSSSARAKYADALRRISLACRNSQTSRFSAFILSATSIGSQRACRCPPQPSSPTHAASAERSRSSPRFMLSGRGNRARD